MKTHLYFPLLLLITLLLACLCQRPSLVEEPTATLENVSPTSIPTETPTLTTTPRAIPMPTDTPVPTNTVEPTPTDTPMPTDTPRPTATDTPMPIAPTDTPVPPTDTPAPTAVPGERFINISMAPPEDFRAIASLGAGSVGTRRRGGSEVRDLTVLLDQARACGLRLLVQSEGRGWFQTGDKRFDHQKLYDVIYAAFGDNEVASDPDFIGYYIVDEPCNPNQWTDMTQQDMAQFYATVKSVDPNIPIIVNYGHPGCLERFIPSNCPSPPGADVALVTIDPVKWEWPGYMDEVNAAAVAAKACYPELKVVVAIGVYGLPKWGGLPSPDYVRDTGFAILSYPALDGFIYFSWSPDPYMTASISDVADDPAYLSAFADVFNAAGQ